MPAGQELQLARAVAPFVLRKRPAGQGLHEEEPGAEAKAPKPQGAQRLDPAAALKKPGAQGTQASKALTPPALLPHVPGGHTLVQPGCPAKEENVPFTQGTQAAAEVDPVAGLAVPAGQAEHTVAPPNSAKLPAEQVPHDALDDAPTMALARPGAHASQATAEDAPEAAPHVPEGHGTQTLLEFAPTAADHVPAGHSEHVSEPCAEEKPPAPQGAQAVDALPLTPVAAEPRGQGVQVLAPSEEKSPAPHALQTIEPASGAAKPLPQSAQAEASTAPGAPEAVPGGQRRHPEEV